MKIACLLHADLRPPVSIIQWIESRDYELLTCNFILGELEPSLNEVDFIIALGGPFSATDSQFTDEKRYLKEAVLLNKPVVGICLGMQLLGEALGATTVESPLKETGFSSVSLNAQAKMDPIASLLPESFDAFHFHAQMSGLPKGSVVLAESAGCPRQIVRFTRLAYGLQCHLELDFQSAKLMAGDLPGFDFSNTHRLLHLIFDSLIAMV